MQICVISGSPKGEKSVTLQYVRFLEQAFPEHTFSVAHVGREIRTIEQQEEVWNGLLAAIKECDGVLWATPVYCLLVPAQLKRFIELVGDRNAMETFSGKYTAALTTSIHYFDHTAHAYLHGVRSNLSSSSPISWRRLQNSDRSGRSSHCYPQSRPIISQ